MKYYNLLLWLLFFLGCNYSDDATIQFLREGIETGSEYLMDINDDNYSKIEAAYYENPYKVKKHKKLTDSLKIITRSVIEGYETLHTGISNNESIKAEIRKDLSMFKAISDSLGQKDSALFNLSSIINSKDIAEPLKNKELIINKIKLLENYIVDKELKNIQGLNFHVNKLMVGVFTKQYKLKKNELFEANLRLLAFDTAILLKANIDKKTIPSKNGIINYIDSTIRTNDKINKEGSIIWSAPFSEVTVEFPISIKYQIREK